jgi:hypothetical protein
MRQQTRPLKEPAEKVVQDIRRVTRKHYSVEEKNVARHAEPIGKLDNGIIKRYNMRFPAHRPSCTRFAANLRSFDRDSHGHQRIPYGHSANAYTLFSMASVFKPFNLLLKR